MIDRRRAFVALALLTIVSIGSARAEPALRNAGTLFWIDPKEQFIAVYMVQVNNGDRIMLRNQFRTMVRSAIIN